MAVGDHGGTLRVELNHSDSSVLPSGFRFADNDTRILAVARNLAADGRDVVLVSKDLPMRVKASAVGITAEEYRAELAVESGWTGMVELDVLGPRWTGCTTRSASSWRPRASSPATPAWSCQ